ncbi:MAG: hypothetical protein COW45_00760 [Gallionellales bacterium CG17_big_fil_post_rev_8_21_14_2_50_54_146]|nr:MAG: hypothetical protein COW45_00760 [Gallionellales bacterium CG17_big_fil_post_rev_8_21_14_2_50_54_146]
MGAVIATHAVSLLVDALSLIHPTKNRVAVGWISAAHPPFMPIKPLFRVYEGLNVYPKPLFCLHVAANVLTKPLFR